ncbi:phosphonate ABC transporter ATP-binding protein [Nocardioides lianchengensis]|uniref:Phosphonate transport system ATP-binding protein n=1 Tax=Nocardioides lianchengensis TaxID=1045774 RepID=A0A1G7C7L3_9ACTN|nr:ATP-binding cassette domain-containing protein [Nocardioides lianchengensis]NYG09260.1 phosphonate transport system ATP-binding protein [Nocardioides lianchengensis]SDE34740.1 phosphonate transport system ATP-binding protein [Nocardioides lianchengensis]
MAETGAGLRVRGLTKSYGDRHVLHGVDVDVAAGELVTILGANGSGKSTLLRCVIGLERAESGTVLVAGESRTSQPTSVAMVFQKIDLVGRYTALDNVCSGALGRLSGARSLHPRLFPRSLREEAMACLDEVGLADRAHDPVRRLSGGQQQRVAVARALCQRPSVLLADEPVSALDPAAAEQVMGVLARIAHQGLAVLAVLHQPDIARRHSDRILGLRSGRPVFAGAPSEVDLAEVDALYAVPAPRPSEDR